VAGGERDELPDATGEGFAQGTVEGGPCGRQLTSDGTHESIRAVCEGFGDHYFLIRDRRCITKNGIYNKTYGRRPLNAKDPLLDF
jgi:hypothetical protein